ncbi:hypothetical protein [Streptomyces sp. G1]|uniref:hypothetical protein n=1 Tax=Streptomyces sp. G1 TaxID=361572 RepID=UPI0035ABF882
MLQGFKDVPRVVWLLAAGILGNAVVSFPFVFLYLTGPRGLGAAQAGLIVGIGGVGLVAGNFTGGWYGDRFGHRRVLLTASVLGTLFFALWTARVVPAGAAVKPSAAPDGGRGRGSLWGELRARPAVLVLLGAIVVIDIVCRQHCTTFPVLLAAPLGGALYDVAPGLLWPLCAVLGTAAGGVVLVMGARGTRRRARPAHETGSRPQAVAG